MLANDPSDRISVVGILSHPWFDLDEDEMEEQIEEKKVEREKWL